MQEKTMFIADDGKEFDTREACEAYEAEQKRIEAETTYWYVLCGADCTEGRGFTSAVKYKVPFKFLAEQYMNDFLYRTIGNQVDFIQGVAPTPAWMLTQIDKAEYDRDTLHSFGDNKRQIRKFPLIAGRGGGLRIDE